ncbi:MAG: RagB/SusD family nutrient uptake outer membrane protein [Chitinophagaceae bacterium]|nr:RagB/SusD family nutrient uptake outer membrane protein [Chitinophagaceae bacterium]
MKQNIKLTNIVRYVMIILVVAAGSCKKLQEDPKSIITPDTYYNTIDQVQSALVAAQSHLWDQFKGYQEDMFLFNQDDQITRGNLEIPEDYASTIWAAHYAALLNINQAIASLNKGLTNTGQEQMDQVMAQAKFLRAFNYFMLVREFGGVPLLTDETPDLFGTPVARSSIEEVYAQIIADFTAAIGKLPVSYEDPDRGLPTRDAAKGLLAKAYLTMATYPLNKTEYYANAAQLAGEIIADGNYSLVPDIKDLFSAATKYGPEMMWSFNSNNVDLGPDPRLWSDMQGFGTICAEPAWEQAYPPSPRKDAFIETELDGVKYYDLGDYWPGVHKFQYDSPEDIASNRSIVNMPIIRFADVLLIFAEADNMANGSPTPAAVDALNKVIDRGNGYVPNTADPLATLSMSKEEFDTKVIEERNYELCFEMDRWFDLVRKRILEEKTLPDYVINFTEDDYLWPIPSVDVRVNKLEQNPGY